VAVQVAVLENDARAVRPSDWKLTSTSLAFAGSGSSSHCGLMSQLIANRSGGS